MNSNNQVFKKQIKNYSNTDRFIFLLVWSYFISIPFYFWKSGLPQISDIVMFFLIIIYTVTNKFNIKIKAEAMPIVKTSLYFVTYVLLINLLWMMMLNGDSNFIRVSLYYIFNFLILVLFLSLYSSYGSKIFMIVYQALIASVYIQLLIFVVNGGFDGTRMIGNFNNPNQLAYYALLTSSILLYLVPKVNAKPIWFILAMTSTTLLIISSLSSTAILAYIILITFFSLSKTENKKLKKKFIIILGIMIIFIYFVKNHTTFFENSKMVIGLKTRFNTLERKTANIVTERGYNRITKYPKYWIFGAGEGAYRLRFGSRLEFHSLFGNIQVSYGLVGSLLFLKILYDTVRKEISKKMCVLLPIFIYGVTHNGVRSGLFWILLSLLSIDIKGEN